MAWMQAAVFTVMPTSKWIISTLDAAHSPPCSELDFRAQSAMVPRVRPGPRGRSAWLNRPREEESMHGRIARYRISGDPHELARRAEEGMLPIFKAQPGFRA